MWRNILPQKSKYSLYKSRKERLQMLVLGLASIYEGLVVLLSAGYLTTDIRAYLLFDVFVDD